MKKALYNKIKSEYGKRASWAIWCDQCPYCAEVIEGYIDELKVDTVFVGLNVSRDISGDTYWKNFHHKHRGSNDKKLSEALNHSQYRGSYMTDILKDYPESDSIKIEKLLDRKDKKFMKQLNDSIDNFLCELKTIGAANSKLFLFGIVVEKIFKNNDKLKRLNFQKIIAPAARGQKFDEIYDQLNISRKTQKKKCCGCQNCD